MKAPQLVFSTTSCSKNNINDIVDDQNDTYNVNSKLPSDSTQTTQNAGCEEDDGDDHIIPKSVFDIEFDKHSLHLFSENDKVLRYGNSQQMNVNELIASIILESREPKKHLYERKQPLKMYIGKFTCRIEERRHLK